MSMQITNAFVEQFNANFTHLFQQKKSKLEDKVRRETQRGQVEYFDQIGIVNAVKRTLRHGDTPRMDTPHDRRAITMDDYEWSDLVDDQDKLRMLSDPTSSYLESARMAFKRLIDEVLIGAATGIAQRSAGPGTPLINTPLPPSQEIAVNFVSTGPAVNSGLTLDKLIEAKSILAKAHALEDSEQMYLVYSQQQLNDLLLNVNQISNADYANVKALVAGEVDHFMGFKFVKTELLAKDTGTDIRTCFAYIKPALCLTMGEGITSKITERPDKSYSTQAYLRMTMGASRMHEEGVVSILCDESP